MGWWDTTKRVGEGAATGGLSEVARTFDPATGYSTAAKGADKAGQDYKGLAQTQWGQQMQGLDQGQGYFNQAQGAYNNIYGAGGAGAGPGAAEQWFHDAQSGHSPYFDRIQQQQSAALNQQMNARGGFNSGAALAAQGNLAAGIQGEKFNQMGQWAGQAQAGQQNRVNQMFNAQDQLASQRAGYTGQMFGNAGQQYGAAYGSGINAQANAAQLQGMGQSARSQQFWNGLQQAGQVGAAAAK